MDTRSWGPPGWRFLHWLTFPRSEGATDIRAPVLHHFFVNLLPYVLPCKYCRASFSEFIADDPPDPQASPEELDKWLWRIHNRVSGKLRQQGYSIGADPDYSPGTGSAEAAATAGADTIPGWDFLQAVALAVPECEGSGVCGTEAMSLPALNAANAIPYAARMDLLREFWQTLPLTFPTVEPAARWLRVTDDDAALDDAIADGRVFDWLHAVRCAVAAGCAGAIEDREAARARIGAWMVSRGDCNEGTCRVASRP